MSKVLFNSVLLSIAKQNRKSEKAGNRFWGFDVFELFDEIRPLASGDLTFGFPLDDFMLT